MKTRRLRDFQISALFEKCRPRPLRLLCLLLLGLPACSPYNFSREVSGFGSGVEQLSNGFAAGYAALAADRAALAQLELTSRRARVALVESCLALPVKSVQTQAPCALYPMGGTPPSLMTIEQSRQQTMDYLAALQKYAHALVAVTSAADRATYDAAVAQLASAVGTLASKAGPQGAVAGGVAPAAVNLVGWIVGAALDQQRFDSLKAGVNKVGTPLPDGIVPIDYVAGVAGGGLYALALAQRAVLTEKLTFLTKPLGPSLSDAAYRQRLGDAEAVVAVLDALRQSDPQAAANGLITAHKALVAAVDDPGRNYASLVKAVGDFVDKATALRAALTATPAAAAAK
jgi:hypothetical protein